MTGIRVHPTKGEPGEELAEAVVGIEGLDGDRRKKAAVQVVAGEDVAPDTRANFVVTLASTELLAAIGSGLRVGEVGSRHEHGPQLPRGARCGDRAPCALGTWSRLWSMSSGAPVARARNAEHPLRGPRSH